MRLMTVLIMLFTNFLVNCALYETRFCNLSPNEAKIVVNYGGYLCQNETFTLPGGNEKKVKSSYCMPEGVALGSDIYVSNTEFFPSAEQTFYIDKLPSGVWVIGRSNKIEECPKVNN